MTIKQALEYISKNMTEEYARYMSIIEFRDDKGEITESISVTKGGRINHILSIGCHCGGEYCDTKEVTTNKKMKYPSIDENTFTLLKTKANYEKKIIKNAKALKRIIAHSALEK